MATQRGPDAVRNALVEAAAFLFARSGDASVREIAAKAGVNHGLVHHYFGGKLELRRAALAYLVQGLVARVQESGSDDPSQLARVAFRTLRAQPQYVQLLARSILDDALPAPFQPSFPVVERVIDALGDPDDDRVKAAAANALALALGWLVFEPWVCAATGLASDAAATTAEAAVQRCLREAQEGRRP